MQRAMKTLLPVVVILICFASGSAIAQSGIGIRAGVTADPTQFHFGGHYITKPFFKALSFRPNLEIGFGDNVTTIATNFEVAYSIPIPNSNVSAYFGAGPALLFYNFDDFPDHDTDTGGGFNILIGAEYKHGFFGEFKIGTFDSPDFKFTVGFTFR